MSPWIGEAHALAQRIRTFILSPTEADFGPLALDIHRWQAQHSPVTAALTEAPPAGWRSIPPVPVDLFKQLAVGTVSPEEASVCFRTSGTTQGQRGSHYLRSTALYDLGAQRWARACVPAAPTRVIALLSDPHRAPDSSLSHMVAGFSAPGGSVSWHLGPEGLHRSSLDEAVSEAQRPVYLATTAFALAEWLDQPVPALPPGSVLMVTGGFKGRTHRLEGEALYRAARQALAPARLVTEYGMTELSSQLWGRPGAPYTPPPWMRVLAVDPHSGAPLAPGQVGQLRFIDLCNLDSAVAIETLDQGAVHPNGRLTLHGRLADAPARGCSLTVEETWG